MKKKIKKINAAILIIGNEILSGRTQDKNVQFISNWLNSKCGISVKEVRIIPDIENIIIENIKFLSRKFSIIMCWNGLTSNFAERILFSKLSLFIGKLNFIQI